MTMDCTSVDVEPVSSDIAFQLSNLDFICVYKQYGCEESLNYNQIQNHLETCEYKVTKCIYCNTTNPATHRKVCKQRPVLCEHCGDTVTYSELESHYDECDNLFMCKECGT